MFGAADLSRQVEGSDNEPLSEQALLRWFEVEFGRSFPVPDLEGLTFIGGRLFFVNGVPTGQIAYHDEEGRLTGFCFSPAPQDQTTDPAPGADGDLNLSYWEKGGFRYVLLGQLGADRLNSMANELSQTYGEAI